MLTIVGQHDDKTIQQMWRCLGIGSVHRGAIMADGHLGYAQPVGGVVAYTDHISISGVGYDIACGNKAIKTDFTYDEIKSHLPAIIRDIQKKIEFGIGRQNGEVVDDPLFESDLWYKADVSHLKRMACGQLGTVGSGNHYVDFFRGSDGYVWIGVHFGSRGLGHKTASKYLELAGGKDGMEVAPTLVEADSDLGRAYLAGMELAGLYAYAGRNWVCETIRKMFAAKVTFEVHNHHNYAWKENGYWVVRKGATPAYPGQYGFIGGSMGDDAVIVRGLNSERSKDLLHSTVHGAGRICGRIEAKGKRNKDGTWKREPRFTREQMDQWLITKGVTLFGGDVDESPMAYRRLTDVLAEHEGTIEVMETLTPFLVFMAGNDVRDPYKD